MQRAFREVIFGQNTLCFEPCKYDPEVWFCSAMKDDGTDYYQYVLLYTDGILAILNNTEDFIRHELGKTFVVNSNYILTPTKYLRNNVSYVTLENFRKAWRFNSSQHVQDAVENVIDTLAQEGRTVPKRGNFFGLVTIDLILILLLKSLHQEMPTINL